MRADEDNVELLEAEVRVDDDAVMVTHNVEDDEAFDPVTTPRSKERGFSGDGIRHLVTVHA